MNDKCRENITPKRGKSALNSTSSGVWSAVKHCEHFNAFAFIRERNNIFLMNAQMNWPPLVPRKYIYLPPFPSSSSCYWCTVLCWQSDEMRPSTRFSFGLFRTVSRATTFSICEWVNHVPYAHCWFTKWSIEISFLFHIHIDRSPHSTQRRNWLQFDPLIFELAYFSHFTCYYYIPIRHYLC